MYLCGEYRKITSIDVFSYEILHTFGVFLRVILVGHGVCGTGGKPQFFGFRFCLVEGIYHPGGHVCICIAMNEEHRQFAFPDLIQRRSFLEVPAVFRVAQPTGSVHQRERRQPELPFQLVGEFVPYAGITAIFHKTFHKGC